jgi:hypothetical protein
MEVASATMDAALTYRPREGLVAGFVAGKPVSVPTQRDQARIAAWEKVQETRSGQATQWDHTFELPHRHIMPAGSVQVGPAAKKLTVAENSALEIYDWPGEYAQRFDGVDKGGGSNRGLPPHRHGGSMVFVREPGGGVCLHGSPACSDPRCIVVLQGWDSLFGALKQARQLTMIVEL